MIYLKLCILGGLVLFLNLSLYSQEVVEEPQTEVNSVWDDDFDMKLSVSHPTIEIKYGTGNPSFHEDLFKSSFEPINSVEVRLGFLKKETTLLNNDK